MGIVEPGSWPTRLQAGPLPSIEGDRRGASAVEIRRFGLAAGRTSKAAARRRNDHKDNRILLLHSGASAIAPGNGEVWIYATRLERSRWRGGRAGDLRVAVRGGFPSD